MGSIILSVLCNNAAIANTTIGTDKWISIEHDTHWEKPAPVQPCLPSIPHGPAWEWTDAYKVTGYCMAWNCIRKEEYLQLAASHFRKAISWYIKIPSHWEKLPVSYIQLHCNSTSAWEKLCQKHVGKCSESWNKNLHEGKLLYLLL